MATDQKVPERVRFADFEFDYRSGELRRAGSSLKLQPQPANILSILVQRQGEIVSRRELTEAVWGAQTFVDFEQSLNHAIRQIRSVLEDDADQPRFVETLPKRGYRFIAPICPLAVPALEKSKISAQNPEPRPVVKPRFSLLLLCTAALALLCIFVFIKFRSRIGAFAVSDTHRINSLAVLPLRNLSADPAQEYFSDGMTDELITALAKSTGLRVISHTSVDRYKDTKRPLPDIAKELAVDAIVEGTVTRSADRIRITAQLIDAHSDQHVWAESYEGELRDVLGLQDRVAMEVAREIGSKLASPGRIAATPKVDPGAYEAYLRGMFAFDQMRCTSFGKALGYFQEAVGKDPSFAPAYAGLADSYFELSDWRCSQTASFDKAQASALRAVSLDPGLADAHAVLAEIAFARDWNWVNAASEFKKAIQLDPNDAAIRASYGTYLVAMGNEEQGLAEMHKAHQIDPVSEKTNIMYTTALFFAHRFDEAITQAQQASDLLPSSYGQYYWLGECYEQKQMPAQAISAYLEMWDRQPDELSRRRTAYQKDGIRGYWREDEQYRTRIEKLPVDAFFKAMYFAHAGENSKALEQLKLAYKLHCSGMEFLKVDPHFDGLRDNPDFKALLAQLAL